MNANVYATKDYKNETALRPKKTNPKQTQSNPIAHKKRLMTPLSHQSLLFHCPVYGIPKASPQLCLITLKVMSYKLLKCDTYTNFSIFEQFLAVNSDNFAGFDTCKLSFFLCQGLCSRKIELYNMPWPDWHRYRKGNKYARFANIAASTVKKPVGFRYPNTNRPGNDVPAILTLLC